MGISLSLNNDFKERNRIPVLRLGDKKEDMEEFGERKKKREKVAR